MSISKKILLDQFTLLSKQITIEIDNNTNKNNIADMFRLKTIDKIIKTINNINKNNVTIDDFNNIKGIGKKSLTRIQEIINTGKLSEIKIDIIQMKYLKYLEELEEVYGIGRKLAYKLFTNYNIKSIKDLQNLYKQHKINLPDIVVKGLNLVDKIQDNIPRKDIDDILDYLLKLLYDIDLNLFGTICGSYRRLQQTSGDIDFIVVHNELKTKEDMNKSNINYLESIINILIKNKFIQESLTGIDVSTKYMGVFIWKNILRRIDIRFMPYDSYYTSILYFTGSKDFNRKMRLIASNKNYLLNEYGIYDKNNNALEIYDKYKEIKSEKDIFDILDMDYLTPDKRN